MEAWSLIIIILLQTAIEMLGDEIQIKTFNRPIAYLDFIETYVPHLETVPFLRGRKEADDYETINHLPVDINSSALMQLPSQAERKNEISVLIVDYHMPEMNGLELCRILKNTKFKKILLTGEADTVTAVEAFNEGIIDCFLQKNSQTLIADVKHNIAMLTNEYFIDQGKVLLSHLETDKKIPLSDPAFVSFFKKWCKKNSIREHYIFDKHGNIQAVDSAGNEFYFVIYTDDLLNQFSDLYNDSKGMSEYISAVKERKKIPFFGIAMEAWQFDHSNWSQHFYMPEKLEGREKYYWAVKRKEN